MSQPYILVVNGKPEGPFSTDELKVKNIKPGDFVKTEEMPDYKEAQEIAELRELFGFAKPALLMQYFGSFDQRLVASVLDWFIVFGSFVIIIFIVVILIIQDKETRMIASFALLGCVPVANFIYHIVMECSTKQGTLGKQMIKIKVVDMYGERITPGKSITRNFAKILSVMTFFIGYLLAFFNKQQQCLHDMLAGTLVIKERLF
jgi:uncharacterized RDD family membrane protein YckC